MNFVGFGLQESGDLDQAEAWYRKSVATGDSLGTQLLASVIRAKGDEVAADAMLRESAIMRLDGMRAPMSEAPEESKEAEFEKIRRRGAEFGDSMQMVALGIKLQKRGDLDEAESWFRKSIDDTNVHGMSFLASLLREASKLEEAEIW
jgi:TPR repeat protein